MRFIDNTNNINNAQPHVLEKAMECFVEGAMKIHLNPHIMAIDMITRYSKPTQERGWPFEKTKAEAVHKHARARTRAIRSQPQAVSNFLNHQVKDLADCFRRLG